MIPTSQSFSETVSCAAGRAAELTLPGFCALHMWWSVLRVGLSTHNELWLGATLPVCNAWTQVQTDRGSYPDHQSRIAPAQSNPNRQAGPTFVAVEMSQ